MRITCGDFKGVGRYGGEAEEPVAVETELGWVLSGPLKKRDHLESQSSSQDVSVNFVGHDSVDLD